MPASIYKSPRGRAEILRLYNEAAARLGVEYEDLTVGTRSGDTHVLAVGPEDAPPVMVLPGGNFLNPTCLGWLLPLAEDHRLYSPDIVGQPGKSAQERPRPGGRRPRVVGRRCPGRPGARTSAARRRLPGRAGRALWHRDRLGRVNQEIRTFLNSPDAG